MKNKKANWLKSDDRKDIPMNRAARRQVKKQTGVLPAPLLTPLRRKDKQ